MDFAYTPEQESLRKEVRKFIEENVTPEILAEIEESGVRNRGPKTRAMYQKIGEKGWIGISWPREYGGQGGSRIDQYIVEEEFARIGITVGGAGSGAPAILAAGTEEQKKYFLPGLIRGEIIFALGFTEPQAGADLAGLQCRAVRDRLAELWIEAQVCRLMTMRSMSLVERGGNFTYEGSAEKVWAPEHGVKTTETIAQILGAYGQLLNGSEDAIESGVFAHNLMGAFQSGINHGSVQVMRDQVARRGLGMPRG